MTSRSALIFFLSMLGISIGGLLALTQASKAQEQSCATKVLGLGIPDDSAPKQILLVTFADKAYVGLVEQNGCIRYEVAVPINLHVRALKAATAGV